MKSLQMPMTTHFRLPCTDYNPYEVTLGATHHRSSKGEKKESMVTQNCFSASLHQYNSFKIDGYLVVSTAPHSHPP